MNLLEIRTQLVNESGRFDLVVDVTDYVDAGANFHITAGLKYLDRKVEWKNQKARNFQMVAANAYYVTFQHCRVIERVWCADTDSRLELLKVDMEDLRGTDYPSQINAFVKPFSATDTGRPLYYAPANLRTSPAQDRAGMDITEGYGNYMDVMLGESSTYNGVVFMAPADKAYMIEVEGKFLSAELTADLHENAWSIEHPEILIMAAMRNIEIMNRNSEGRKDWTGAIGEALFDLEKDFVDEESNAYDVMEG